MRISMSRRMFLRGTGTALAIPTLASLLPKPLRAQAPAGPVRYLQWITDHGQYDHKFWPDGAPTDPVRAGGQTLDVTSRSLASYSGPLSEVLGPEFDPVRGKMNLLRGLDILNDRGLHNACAPTCASWPREDDHIPAFSHSVDAVLEEELYSSPVRVPVLRMTPGVPSSYKWGSFCWTRRNGNAFKLPCYEDTGAAFDVVFPPDAGGETMRDPVAERRRRLTDQVMEDYRHVSGSRSLSRGDRQLLSDYMDLLADVQNRMGVSTAACSRPELAEEVDFDALHRNAIDIACAALLCGATRVVAYHCYQGSPTHYDEETFHTWAHDDAERHGVLQTWRYRQLAHLLQRMDSLSESDGTTLLDNSFVYAGNELSDPGHGSGHLRNMPIITAGSAGERLVTGEYIDFQGRLMNNLLVTVFAVMGVDASAYERDGVVGFGDYEGRDADSYAAHLTTTARRSPLPYLYRG